QGPNSTHWQAASTQEAVYKSPVNVIRKTKLISCTLHDWPGRDRHIHNLKKALVGSVAQFKGTRIIADDARENPCRLTMLRLVIVLDETAECCDTCVRILVG